jgi:transposase
VGEQRQSFNETFKKEAVKYVQEQTKTVPQIAEELNINVETLRQWMGKYREFENEPVPSV